MPGASLRLWVRGGPPRRARLLQRSGVLQAPVRLRRRPGARADQQPVTRKRGGGVWYGAEGDGLDYLSAFPCLSRPERVVLTPLCTVGQQKLEPFLPTLDNYCSRFVDPITGRARDRGDTRFLSVTV